MVGSTMVAGRGGAGLPHDPTKTKRLVVHVPLDLAAELEAYKNRYRAVTLSDVLRRLLVLGLEVEAERDREAKKPKK